MRKHLFILLLAAGLCACGGSSTSTLGGQTLSSNVISTTVEVERRFVYALNREEGSVSGFVIPSDDEGGHGHHHHGHSHKMLLAQHDHDHDDDHEHDHDHHHDEGHDHDHHHDHDHDHHHDHDHDHEHDHDHHHNHDHEEGGAELVELDGSPFSFAGITPIDMVVGGQGRQLFLLQRSGALTVVDIDGVSGRLSRRVDITTSVSNARFLRPSEDGNAVAIVGDSLAIYSVASDGSLSTSPAFVQNTQDWVDLRLRAGTAIATTPSGAAGFSWSPMALLDPQPLELPGDARGQASYTADGAVVVNSDDGSLSELSQDQQSGRLTLLRTVPLPEQFERPFALTALFGGDDLLVGDADSVLLLHLHDGELEEEGHAELHEAPAVFFPLPDTNVVLVGHNEGHGYHVLRITDDGLQVDEGEGSHGAVNAFGYAQRVELVTGTLTL